MRGEKDMTSFNLFLFYVYRSTFSPLIIFTFLFITCFLENKIKNRVATIIATILALGVTVLPIIYLSVTGSMAMLNLAVAFVMTATVFILNFVKLSLLDYIVLFSSFAYISRFVGIGQPLATITALSGLSIPALYTFIALLVVYKIKFKQLKGNLFYFWFTWILTFIKGYGISFLFSRYVVGLGQRSATRIEALFIWGNALFVIVIISTAIIYFMKKLLKKHFDNINNMGKTYPQIERFFIYNSIGIIIFTASLHSIYLSHSNWLWTPFSQLFNWFLLFALILQLLFLIMVFRITWLKDSLKHKAVENQSLAIYSSSLEKNIDNIKHIKHDVKNIFLTMGNFVEQSGNTEMQDFYHKKISPFATDEIAKNDLYSKLSQLNNEQLKAFMFYKISQAVERNIDVSLDVSVQCTSFESATELPMEFVDLVRILGILLDNSIEECMLFSDGSIHIKISQNDEMISYMIKNTIRSEIKEKGIKSGISTKGKNKGNGLIIVRSIIENYDFVSLNSYFHEDSFVQNIVIYSK